jgi:hypothetical protein
MTPTTRKKILLGTLAAIIAMQFFQPALNIHSHPTHTAIEKHFDVPADVQQILKTSCYDCHSNNTQYPWYFKLQPLGWWLDHHIEEGKEHLNFDEFATYTADKQKHKLEEVVETIQEHEMPLKSYTLVHRDAQLISTQQQQLIKWAQQLQQRL